MFYVNWSGIIMLLVDIGNTQIKAVIVDGEEFKTAFSCPTEDIAKIKKNMLYVSPSISNAFIASVVPERCSEIKKILEESDLTVTVIEHDKIIKNTLATPQTTGVDRLLTARGAYEKEKSPCIIIDMGTAVTIDAVDARGAFVGGCIIPGEKLWFESLHNLTSQLPLLSLENVDLPLAEIPGNSTAKAIKGGTAFGLCGAIEKTAGILRDKIKGEKIFLTGGNAEKFVPLLEINVEYSPALLFEGMKSIALSNRKM
jgi:type III pantothenate kinase